ncbi:glycosyltransferase family 4 protein [Sulfolobus acidocaldarius]|uniref:Glycosyl transferase family 1 domain-containing protein n=4 Tax=Sulfolobus acidocaldarius TaxID=2285 RepID=Q4J7K7_SULAC|nr:glycosyltransferase family 4 protein [Sulfolobus acidocaldarius]AAY81224.1 hypothetical protein Saci_1921 [Sulfolobus acidocaldarius DSM 639]AGE71846.1 hypothetical protein SacN8_09435 [Sulfolobus acidocaldarius N8]AGE74118.1 hypothetical protein SacRon12I_09455 [Sulfolobus acidocaldarius Ron12/I]ALU29968.1 hypothetical protein ATY89_08490 [Sulfolobus acidocaldarius]ALU32710.1 hypothetical protein ATZ20_11495 [Sulfolobus acidocaldarius]
MLSITFLIGRLPLTGGNYSILEIANRLLRRGFDVKIVTTGAKVWYYDHNKVPIIYPKEPKVLKYLLSPLSFKYKMIKEFAGFDYYYALSHLLGIDFDFAKRVMEIIPQSDLLIVNEFKTALWGFLAKWQGKVKRLAFFPQLLVPMSVLYSSDPRWYLSYFLPHDYYFALSNIDAKLAKPLLRSSTRVFVTGVGVDSKLFRVLKSYDKREKNVIMTILRSEKIKNSELAIRTLNSLAEKINFSAIIVDHGVLNTLKDKIKFKYISYSHPTYEEMVKLYNEASVFLITSRLESYSLTTVEAMSCGTPVVTTDNIGMRAYVINRENALVSKHHDEKELLSLVLEVLSNPRLALRLVENGIKTAKANDWDNVIERWIDVLKQIEVDI